MKCNFEFVCDRKWEALQHTSRDDMKFCNHCDKNVYLAEDEDQLNQLAKRRACAYFKPKNIKGTQDIKVTQDKPCLDSNREFFIMGRFIKK